MNVINATEKFRPMATITDEPADVRVQHILQRRLEVHCISGNLYRDAMNMAVNRVRQGEHPWPAADRAEAWALSRLSGYGDEPTPPSAA